MTKQLIKGNEAIVKGAILGGCRAFYGYPITPASEIAEAAALYLPPVGGTFLQAESEVAAINMVYGAAAAGLRAMTASSGPGISLMQEGISYLAGAELPAVVADIMRGGPGLGNIAPEQGDYHQVVKGGGHGNYRTLVLAPASVQEMADLTWWAFELADEYRNPVVVLADGTLGQMMEPVSFPLRLARPRQKSWAVEGTGETRTNLVTSIYLEPDELEANIARMEAKYRRAELLATRAEFWRTDDADLVLVGYGIVARILKAVVEQARARGLAVGLLRPITLYPFPVAALRALAHQARAFLVVELSTGQLVEDVRLALDGRLPVEFYSRTGGNLPTAEELLEFVQDCARHYWGVPRAEGRVALASYTVTHQKAASFYQRYLRKPELQHQTHYCPGCGHGVVHKLVARAIDELGLQDRTIFISPVGCSVFAYYYFDVGNIQAAHGRAAAVATAVKRARPESIVISYQGDGDLAAIGAAEILHAANRGENLTVIFINNAIYGMTGGQMAPTTLLGQKTTTTPFGRNLWNEGPPLRVVELLAALEAPVYLERVALGDNKQIMKTAAAVRRAIENQVKGLGFSLVEVLSPCPTIWKMTPVEAQSWVREEMTKAFPLGLFRDRTKEATPRPAPPPAPPAEEIPGLLGIEVEPETRESAPAEETRAHVDLRIKVAGFGGQGVLLLGQVLAEAGMDAGLEVSWLPSYGPEMRSGTSHCHVRLASEPIDSPLISRPNVLLALNEPSLRKFLPSVVAGGWVFYNGDVLPEDCQRGDLSFVVRPFTRLADELGEPRAANIVMLGALLERTRVLTEAGVLHTLTRLVRSERWLEIDRQALARGRQAAASPEVIHGD